ncbi:MAG: AMP-binding protein [Planctomycetes bacterium]|nr:AMP-binding protein [Planctomycetota bacterium]
MAEQQVGNHGAHAIVHASDKQRQVDNLVEMLRLRADEGAERLAFTFLAEKEDDASYTFGQLDCRARAIAAYLQQTTKPGDRVLLVYPPGLDFISAFFGCMYAGVMAVPATYPKPRRPMPRLEAIAGDCQASVALTTSQCLTTLDLGRTSPVLESIEWVATDAISDDIARQWQQNQICKEDLAFLQYTSGSTSDPKGVMVSHENVMHNLKMIHKGFGFEQFDFEEDTAIFWLPAYHDMGLIGGILEPVYVFGESVLMSPTTFLQRPLKWLQTISKFRGAISGAPNFAYDLCVEKTTPKQRASLDLSCWKLAFCGAEPIRAATLQRFADAFAPAGFREDAFYPCYGLAEATLIASGAVGAGRPIVKRLIRSALTEHRVVSANGENAGQVQQLVGCGGTLLEQEIVIVDSESKRRCESGSVGEIWIKGTSVSRGYWNRPEDNTATFNAQFAGSDDAAYLRTGDLGFLSDGQLFVTGRLKDIVVIRGSNHYPQDIERTVEDAHPAFNRGCGAAFSIDVGGQERLVVIHEIDRHFRNENLDEIARLVRNAVATNHELELYAVAIIRHASLPRTTSGKVQRRLCRQHFQAGELKTHLQWSLDGNGKSHLGNGHKSNGKVTTQPESTNQTDSILAEASSSEAAPKADKPVPIHSVDKPLSTAELDQLADRIELFMLDWLIKRAALPAEDVHRDRPFAEFGMDSLTAVELSQELEDWLQVHLTPVVAWNYPTPMALARYLAEQVGGHQNESDELRAELDSGDSKLDDLLAEIESLSEEEAEAALRELLE